MIETVDNPRKWYKDSILLKVGIIAIIILVLLIPSAWIQDLVVQRNGYNQQIMQSVSDRWSGSQLIEGPVLVLPYKKQVSELNTSQKMITHDVIENIYVLPEKLGINAGIKTQKLRQGITDVTVYNAKVLLQGSFIKPEFDKLGIDSNQVLYDKARLIFSMSDLKGLKNNPVVNLAGHNYTADYVYDTTPYGKGLQINFAVPQDGDFNFSYALNIKGSNEFNFMQLGKETQVDINSDWLSPVFSGSSSPDVRNITQSGFTAQWHMLNYNRPFPQAWTGNDTLLTSKNTLDQAVSGVQLHLPVDQYRMVLRTTKYATLIILLTFVSLFFTEVIRKQRIHLFNYTLIGAAMVVYYTLLLSFAEQIGYDLAYLTASVATIGLIAWFTSSLLKSRPAALLFSVILSVFYGFIYVIIQLEDFSLMIGSIALFIIIATLMYFSRTINWDKH